MIKHRWPQFSLGAVFLATTIAGVLIAACTGAFGQVLQIVSLAGCLAALATLVAVPPVIFLGAGIEWLTRRPSGREK